MSAAAALRGGGSLRFDLGSIDRIPPGEGQTFLVEGREIAVFRSREDEVWATQARCPHKGGLLADGIVGAQTASALRGEGTALTASVANVSPGEEGSSGCAQTRRPASGSPGTCACA